MPHLKIKIKNSFAGFVKSKQAKQEVSCTVILPPTASVVSLCNIYTLFVVPYLFLRQKHITVFLLGLDSRSGSNQYSQSYLKDFDRLSMEITLWWIIKLFCMSYVLTLLIPLVLKGPTFLLAKTITIKIDIAKLLAKVILVLPNKLQLNLVHTNVVTYGEQNFESTFSLTNNSHIFMFCSASNVQVVKSFCRQH